MDDVHGKEIVLARTTVKVPGMRPRGSRPAMPMTNPNHSSDFNNLARSKYTNSKLLIEYNGKPKLKIYNKLQSVFLWADNQNSKSTPEYSRTSC